jgi:small GTP-binding protein
MTAVAPPVPLVAAEPKLTSSWSNLGQQSAEGTAKRYGDNSPAAYHYIISVVVLGDSAVGKTSLVQRYAHGMVQSVLQSTISPDMFTDVFGIGQYRVRLELWDTAGQERFSSLSAQQVRGKHGMLLVFDVTNRVSFERVNHWYALAQQQYTPGQEPLVLLVGNKIDLVEKRQVSNEEAQEYARQHNYFYSELSALHSQLDDLKQSLRQFAAACFAHRVSQQSKQGPPIQASTSTPSDVLRRLQGAHTVLGHDPTVVSVRMSMRATVTRGRTQSEDYETDKPSACAC